MLFIRERPKDVDIGKASCVFKGILKIKGKMVEDDHVVHFFLSLFLKTQPNHWTQRMVNI